VPRRRQRRRRLGTGIAVVAALGCALGLFAAMNGNGQPRPTATTGTPSPRPAVHAGLPGIPATVLQWPAGPPNFGPASGPPAWVSDLATGRHVQRQIPGIIGCDCRPYLMTVGQTLVYAGGHGTTAMPADLRGAPRVLGATQFFAPSAVPGHIWLIGRAPGPQRVRLVPVAGGPHSPAITLPRGTWLVAGTDAGLLLQRGHGSLEMWRPGRVPVLLPHRANWYDGFAATPRIVAYGTGCRWARTTAAPAGRVCRTLRVFDVVTGRVVSFPAPVGAAGWVPDDPMAPADAAAPNGARIAAYAVSASRPGRARLFVLHITDRQGTASRVPASATGLPMPTAWSADGPWLFYQGPGGRLWAYQAATGAARESAVPCCGYSAIAAAVPGPP
jgi:hypothetical protein